MPRIRIITDSTADLGPELIQREELIVVPLLVQFDEESYQDGVDMDTERLFRMVETKKKLPKTASPSPAVFQAAFAQATADGSDAIYIGISSKLSATLQNARLAAELFPPGKVRVFDSLNLSTGIGLQVLMACDLARAGKTADEIMAALEAARPKVRTAFVIDTLDYLHKGGRCNSLQALVGSLLKLRPVIAVEDGGMIVAAKLRGARQKGLEWMLERFAADAARGLVRPERVFITHTGVHEDAAFMAGEVRRIMPEVQAVIETRAGSVIGSHCGPGTIGIIYLQK
jgi:DegV family protein with EDD domain